MIVVDAAGMCLNPRILNARRPMIERGPMEQRCKPTEMKALKVFSPSSEDKREQLKSAPDRFPGNKDSIGIELVREALPRGTKVPDEKKIYQRSVTHRMLLSSGS